MADLVNPYANPYLPSFVSQQPKINNIPKPANSVPLPQLNYSGIQYSQIHPVKGFEGADAYANALSPGSSEILSEEDPNVARIFVAAKDANGQVFVQGFNITPIERPKQVTMDDLSSTMNQILERLNKLEESKNDQSNHGAAWKGGKQPGNAGYQSNGRNGQDSPESASSNANNGAK